MSDFVSNGMKLGRACVVAVIACSAAAMAAPQTALAQTAGSLNAVSPMQPASAAVSSATGTVVGTVTDPTGALIPGATITFSNAAGKSYSGTSGSDGTYTLTLPGGAYSAIFAMPGFANLQRTNLHVTAGTAATVNAKMVLGDQTTVVNVTSDAAQVSVDADSNASATVLKGKDLDALSDDPDDLQSELQALAGPAAGPSGGQIYVDGFTGGQLPPKSSIREIRINQNPFSAQYDKIGFGRIEVFTKPGTDKLRLYASVQGNAKPFNTSTPFLGATNVQPEYFTFFSVGTVSGPLSKHASYNVGFEYRNTQLNAIINPSGFYATSATSTTPCAPGQTGCALYAFPASARAVNQPQSVFEISPRVDLALGDKNVLTARYQFRANSANNQGIGENSLLSTGYNSSGTDNDVQLSDTQTVSDRTINETRFEYRRSASAQTPFNTTPQVVVQGNFTSGGNGSQALSTTSDHIEVQNYTSLARGAHFILFGGRLRISSESLNSTAGSNGTFVYNYLLDPCAATTGSSTPSGCVTATTTPCLAANAGVSSYQCGNASQFVQTKIFKQVVSARTTDLGVYVEDQWKVKPNFTFNYGLRFEAQNGFQSPHNFAPRLSLAYGIPRANGKTPVTVLRFGSGYFYDRLGLGDFINVAQLQPNVQQQTTYLSPGAACTPTSIAGCTGGTAGRSTAYSFNPNLATQSNVQSAVGVDQQVGKLGTLSFNYIHSQGTHLYLTSVTPTATTNNYQYQSVGTYKEEQFFISANLHPTASLRFFGYYSLNAGSTDSSGENFITTNALKPSVDYGRASFANRNFGVLGGTWQAPFKIEFSPFALLRSGTPYNLTTGIDENGDSVYNDRPAYIPGVTPNCSVASTFAIPAAGTAYQQIPYNSCLGPTSITFNLRVQRAIGFGPLLAPVAASAAAGPSGPGGPPHGGHSGGGGHGGPFGSGSGTGRKYSLALGAQITNLFNNVNYALPVSVLSSSSFGQFQSLQGRPFGSANAVRTIMLQANFNF
jgi:hypothetical protein